MPKRISKLSVAKCTIAELKQQKAELKNNLTYIQEHTLSGLERNIQRLKHEIEEAKAILCKYTVALPADIMIASKRNYINLPTLSRVCLASVMQCNEQPVMQVETLPVLSAVSEINPINNDRHVTCIYDDKVVGYAISLECFKNMPRDVLVRRISNSIAVQLTEVLK